MPIESKTYILPPTPRIPNSPHPLIHYPGLLTDLVKDASFTPTQIFDLFLSHGWQTQWIARYGPDIQSHYHSTTHECMAVISGGSATIRFGVADQPDWKHGLLGIGERGAGEEGGLDINANVGDVFIIPAGVSHKCFAPSPNKRPLEFRQPEDVERGKAREALDEEGVARHRAFFGGVGVEGEFMMMGAYPKGGVWDFKVGGEHEGRERGVWDVPVPAEDPVLGGSKEGLRGLWNC
ncbi:hypothetical protein HBI56_071330 [Parastagonospora nodorum]|uniref:Cupin type-1 domain-containing protein n=2 Tax=Phaeosphaeria nodorum (strain SN15 / ATCC MYA-4574 / FGSC 10173) TaxID=321614 RepID=A0A7U2EP57_PHANO|nr:hypothetical protein SNOG_09855 [Parastagonospora nodorum SN15]KAH3920532.1 hypothetical protein HBH56_005780 [Parastagonospora nodorum]EAT83120.1 hypothetical protein SNOG_09855 [Parastagonospora nodorum SN15]KAH3938299.1 hypothetical protein HBH54_005770 [Parastagonospora nodorum]KAH3946637.1 hypothetical protein HBH53_126200 [Parastagonospora nodorum]KAH3975201.1 hypothetical protein HBH51_088500 [Parastagonospora nodorum]